MKASEIELSPVSKRFRRTFFVYKITPILLTICGFFKEPNNVIIRCCSVSMELLASFALIDNYKTLLSMLING